MVHFASGCLNEGQVLLFVYIIIIIFFSSRCSLMTAISLHDKINQLLISVVGRLSGVPT